MRERTIVSAVRRMLTARGCWSMKTHGSEVAGGHSDIYACCRGRFVALEVKRPGQTATALQTYVLDDIARSGGISATVHSVAEAEHILDEAGL